MRSWEIEEEERSFDNIIVFLIFCEDEVSEPEYFKHFESATVKVNSIKGQKSGYKHVLKAINYCLTEGIMKYEGDAPQLRRDDIQVWCVFDYDGASNIVDQGKNTDFNESIVTAENRGIRVAWSNDSFELWVLLHFEDVDPYQDRFRTRSTYYGRLTEIFRDLPSPNERLQRILRHDSYSYKKDLKSRRNFERVVMDKIISSTPIAIERAKRLEVFYKQVPKPNHERSPCTLVHHLVEELLRCGGRFESV